MVYYYLRTAIFVAIPSVAVAFVAGLIHHQRTSCSRRHSITFGAVALTVSGILAVTLFRTHPTGVDLAGATHWAPHAWQRFTLALGSDEEILLNVLLFVPAGAALTLWTRRPALCVAGLVALSVIVEVTQGVLGTGNPDLSDLLANSLGAFVGAAVGGLVVLARRRERRLAVELGAFALVTVLAVVAVAPLARHRQDATIAAVSARFAGRTSADLQRWTDDGTLGQHLFTAAGAFSSGNRISGDTEDVRYPTTYLGVRQCVIATWTPSGVTVRGAHGEVCSDAWL